MQGNKEALGPVFPRRRVHFGPEQGLFNWQAISMRNKD